MNLQIFTLYNLLLFMYSEPYNPNITDRPLLEQNSNGTVYIEGGMLNAAINMQYPNPQQQPNPQYQFNSNVNYPQINSPTRVNYTTQQNYPPQQNYPQNYPQGFQQNTVQNSRMNNPPPNYPPNYGTPVNSSPVIIVTTQNVSGTKCPRCGHTGGSLPKYSMGGVAWAWCCCLLWTTGFLWYIPLCSNNCKDIQQLCQQCGAVKGVVPAKCM